MTPREERLKTRMTNFLFDTNQSIKEVCGRLGLTPTAAQLWLFHGFSLKPQQEKIVTQFLNQQNY